MGKPSKKQQSQQPQKEQPQKEQKKKKRDPGARDPMVMPLQRIRKIARRSGALRCGKYVYPVAQARINDTIRKLTLTALRSATFDGRKTIKSRDVRRAMEIHRMNIY